jgi:ankyrin repeat protein
MNRLSEQEKAFVRRVYVNDESILQNSWEKIRAFLNEYPELLEFSSSSFYEREFPLFRLIGDLHYADLRPVRIQQIQQLMEIDASCLLMQDHGQDLPLHCILNRLSSEFLEDLAWMGLLSNIVSAQPSALDIQDIAGDTALHVACRVVGTNALTVVRLLLEAQPKTALARNYLGELPLHLASTFQPTEVVQFLIHESPNSMSVQDRGGNLPLHTACSGYKTMDNIELLVDSYPIALTCKNEQKEAPLHIACQGQASVEVIEYLAQKNFEILSWQDQDGCLPLHYICENYPPRDLLTLMRLHMPLLPQLMQVKNQRGSIPGQQRDPWFPKFSKLAIKRLEEEHQILETLDRMSTVAEALQPNEAFPVAHIILKWTQNQIKTCIEKLTEIESELDNLVETYIKNLNEQAMSRMRDQRRNQTLWPID